MAKKKALKRDAELLKIQVFANYCQAKFNSRISLWISGLVGLLLLALGTAYQGLISWLVFYLATGATTIVFSLTFGKITKDYHNDLDQIQVFLSQVEKNEPLPTLKEMREIRKGNAYMHVPINDNFHDFRIEVEKINPVLFKKKLQQRKVSRFRTWKLVGQIWKEGKGTAIAYIFLLPLFRILVKQREKMIRKFQKIFKENNEKLKTYLHRTKETIRRNFLKTWIELNDVGVEMTTLQLRLAQIEKDLDKSKESFLQNPSAENFSEYCHFMETRFNSRKRFVEILQRKAELQDKAIKYGKSLRKFEKRDLEDFARAILLDIAVSSYEGRALFFQTPIEIMLKSAKITTKIQDFFLLTPMLRAKAKFIKEEQRKLINWLATIHVSGEV